MELERIYLDLSNALHTPEALLVLVAWLPEGEGGGGEGWDAGGGGLLRLAAALFHENQQVRRKGGWWALGYLTGRPTDQLGPIPTNKTH